MPPYRLLLIADDPLARAGLAALLGQQSALELMGQAGGGDDLAALLAVYRPDVLLWDLGWSPQPDLEQLSAALEGAPPTVALLDVALPGEPGRSADVWAAGVSGLLERSASPERITAALAAAAAGLLVAAPEMAGLRAAPSQAAEGPPIEELTPREFDVLRLLAEGAPNKEIARRLAISEHTVKFHVNALLGKLGAQSRTEAVVRATRAGLILL